MDKDEKQFLLTAVWLFAQHGQYARARTICAALLEDNPRDGVAAAIQAELLLEERQAEAALETLRAAEFPPELDRAEALLESRALMMLGRGDEASARWKRFLAARKGAQRQWVVEP